MKKLFACVALCALVGCGGGGAFPDAAVGDAPPPGGTISMQWSLRGPNGPLSCAAAGANNVVAEIQNIAEVAGTTELYPCNTGRDVSGLVSPGTYRVTLSLIGAVGEIARLPAVNNIVVRSSATTEMPTQTFMVSPQGELKLSIASAPGGNCASVGAGGAQIEALGLVLRDASTLACVPTTFAVAAGANRPAATFTQSCNDPLPTFGCVDADQVVSTSVASGSYRIDVQGITGSAGCWATQQATAVPANNQSVTVPLTLARTGAVGCP